MANRKCQLSGTSETLDVVIVGAGISGINSAYRLKSQLPNARFTILENRYSIGGTWDLFKYPGVRSDSKLFTYAFSWRPWSYDIPIAGASLIMQYLKDCVTDTGIDKHIRFGHEVVSADWSSKAQQWRTIVDHEGVRKEFRSQFIIFGTGYYDYKTPLQAKIPGLEDFKGDVVHPQLWPEDYDYTGKKMVVIGSGATAVTLFPSLVKKASKVTIVQRSPSYIISSQNTTRGLPIKYLPMSVSGALMRLWYMMIGHMFFLYCRAYPDAARERLRRWTIPQLPKWVSHDPHFKPAYNPWEQRPCLSPDGDFYEALHSPKGAIVTGHIKNITEHAVEMEDGTVIDTDVIVPATGLKMMMAGGITVSVDRETIDWAERLVWNGTMIQGVPNLFYILSYAQSSWTLGADRCAHMFIRVINNMKTRGAKAATPRVSEGEVSSVGQLWELSSTYFSVGLKGFPKTGDKGCWKRRDNVVTDCLFSRWEDVTTGLQFSA